MRRAVIICDQNAVIEAMSVPAAYGPGVISVERIDTHISVVFLAGDRAYKLKRAIRFPYLDYSTLQLRRQCCEAEVAINRRTAPDLYVGVIPITHEKARGFVLGGNGTPVEWLVVMRRFDQERLFDRLAENGQLGRKQLEALADTIARFHAAAERKLRAGGAAAVAACIRGNAETFAAFGEALLAPARIAALIESQCSTLATVAPMLDARRAAGFVRHCHGDLHLRNVFAADGEPLLFDAIEFSAALSDIDVLYDLAFLLMDLDFRSLRPLAAIALNRYVDRMGDIDGLPAVPLFLSLRAAIRSHVSAAAAFAQSSGVRARQHAADSGRYLELACRYLAPTPPRLVAVGGLSGSGKSRLAGSLAAFLGIAPGARVVRTDITRKRLAGVDFADRLPPAGYAPELTRRAYDAVLAEAQTVLSQGRAVVLDAVFADPAEREAARALATAAGVPFQGVWLETAPDVLEDRVTRRRQNASDADAAVVRRQLGYELGAIDWLRVDSSGLSEATLAAARRLLGLTKDLGN